MHVTSLSANASYTASTTPRLRSCTNACRTNQQVRNAAHRPHSLRMQDHIAHSRVATNQPAQTNQEHTANGNMSNVSAWDQHASTNASQRIPRVGGQRPNMQGSQRMPRVAIPQDANQHVGAGDPSASQRMPRMQQNGNEQARPSRRASSAPFVAVPQLRNPARACAFRQHSRSKASLHSRYP